MLRHLHDLDFLTSVGLLISGFTAAVTGIVADLWDLNDFWYHAVSGYVAAGFAIAHVTLNWLTLNMHRRHLTPDQKRDVIAKLLKTQPSKSNRMIAKQVMVDDKTVGSVRHELQGRAEIPHVSTVEDTKGRSNRRARSAAPPTTSSTRRRSRTVRPIV